MSISIIPGSSGSLGPISDSAVTPPSVRGREGVFPKPVLVRAVDVEHDELEPSSFRAAWLRAIKSEIKQGTYETRERIDGTVERLIDILA